jgi:hypothetical protein
VRRTSYNQTHASSDRPRQGPHNPSPGIYPGVCYPTASDPGRGPTRRPQSSASASAKVATFFLLLLTLLIAANHAPSHSPQSVAPPTVPADTPTPTDPAFAQRSTAQPLPLTGTRIEATFSDLDTSSAIQVGDAVSVILKLPQGTTYQYLEWQPTSDQKKEVRFDRIVGPPSNEFRAIIRPLRDGLITTGPIALEATPYKQPPEPPAAVYIESLTLNVTPLEQEEPKLGKFTAPLEAEYNYLYRNLIIGIGSLIVIGVFGWIAFLMYTRIKTAREIASRPIPRNALEVALEELASLQKLLVFRERGPEAHYTSLSMILRRYIENQIGVKATEMTEDELQYILKSDRKLKYLTRVESLATLLGRISLAKYAKEPLTEEQAVTDCWTVQGFLAAEKDRIAAQLEQARQRAATGAPPLPEARQ